MCVCVCGGSTFMYAYNHHRNYTLNWNKVTNFSNEWKYQRKPPKLWLPHLSIYLSCLKLTS